MQSNIAKCTALCCCAGHHLKHSLDRTECSTAWLNANVRRLATVDLPELLRVQIEETVVIGMSGHSVDGNSIILYLNVPPKRRCLSVKVHDASTIRNEK
jgi:hypothetical protein